MAETRGQENARKRRERAARKARDPEGFLAKERAQRAKWEAEHPNYFREKAKERYRANPEESHVNHRAWVAANSERWAEYMRGWRADNKAHVATYQRQWEVEHPGNVRTNAKKARHKRREAKHPYVRMDPWPTTCQFCHEPLDPHSHGRSPMATSLGHEPPIHWADEHPEYTGPYVIRPEHWKCNLKKGVKPDWES